MFRVHILIALSFGCALLAAGCGSVGSQKKEIDPNYGLDQPRVFLWAWERPEDLRFIEGKDIGVAYLAQTLILEGHQTRVQMRRQPLLVPDGTYMIAVTRIETIKVTDRRPYLDDERIAEIAAAVLRTLDHNHPRGVQIDFDAVASEREFYRRMMFELRAKLEAREAGSQKPEAGSQNAEGGTSDHSQPTTPDFPLSIVHYPLLMTSLASWCTGDAWFNDFPVDEAVPMAFEMGADSEKIRTYLRNGNDWLEPLCRGSYGISLTEGKLPGMRDGRRIYYFKDTPWNASDLSSIDN